MILIRRVVSHSCASVRCLSTKSRYLTSEEHLHKTAIRDSAGDHSYEKLSRLSTAITSYVRGTASRGARVALLMPPSLQFAAGMLGVMNANCVPVPLNYRGTDTELEYLLNNSETAAVLTAPETADIISDEIPSLCVAGHEGDDVTPNIAYEDLVGGIMIYTSGTTGAPKGVLSGYLAFQQWTSALVRGWDITASDSILHTLPLYHVHGILGLFSLLSVGGTVDLRRKFDTGMVWDEFLSESPPSVYYGVPTQYSKLIEHYDTHLADQAEEVRDKLGRLRLMVSGSAPLREPVSDRWCEITGHRLLERYGMTEVGLVITNPYRPISGRRPGCIGLPFPGVKVRLASEQGEVLATAEDGVLGDGAKAGEAGEIQIAGPTLFSQYYNNPQVTEESFTADGWFKTGDTAEIDGGVFKILGRTSSDVIKSGGYKLSALEIERSLLDHPNIRDVAVIGVDDMTWGQKVVAVIESDLTDQEQIETAGFREWCKGKMSPYKIPKDFIIIESLPRNHMGKVNKKSLVSKFSKAL